MRWPDLRARSTLVAVAAALANVVVAAVVAAAYGHDGIGGLVAGLVLAPLGALAAYVVAERVAEGWFAAAASVVYVALPLVAELFFVPAYRSTYTHDVLPTLLGLGSPALLAVGVVIAVAVCFLPARVAAAGGVAAAAVAAIAWGLGGLGDVKVGVHETGWSVTFLEWLPVAGVLGAARRSPWLAAALGGWLVAVTLRAAGSAVETGAFWRELAPALPAAAVLATAIALLVPRLRPAAAPAQPDAP
jgi:hypothetical protein